ncbi:MAG: hypothetical protein V7719_06120 [Psychroserpens sp.]|uniref:hypothetical protein n=1 Tax=Psychroserpens sp. TaxID=2020870 RepID=UPI00300268B3
MNDLRHKIQSLPKGDVHSHLHLSAGIDLLKIKYPKLDFPVPQYYNGFEGMMLFIEQNINTFMTSSEKAISLMDIGIRSSMADNVTCLEASIDINLSRFFNNSVQEFIEAVDRLKANYLGKIDFRPEIGINKDSPTEIIYGSGMQCIESGVFSGLDIYGNEKGRDLSGFQELFLYAKTKKLKTKVHIGEFSGPETIENAIELLEPDEIQHGIHAAESDNTMHMIVERGIRMNVCPHSNIALGAVADLYAHPIRKLYDSGINLTINTDDLLLFNATLTDQYTSLIEHDIFTFEEINEIRKNSLL